MDAFGNAYVTGHTNSANFPTRNALQPTFGGGDMGPGDAFVVKLDALGSAFINATYLGGRDDDGGTAIALDGSGNAYVTGKTRSTDFPIAFPVQPSRMSLFDAFVAKLDATGSRLVYGTYLGSWDDEALGIAVDGSHNAYVAGWTESTDFPTVRAFQPVSGTRPDSIHFKDAFVTKIGEQSPFKGTPFPVPGLFEAEDLDLGGEGVAYHDAVAGNAGGLYRTSEDVDIIAANGNASEFVVNNIQTGEWLEYTINVATAGTYRIEPKVSSEFATSRFHVEIDGVDVTGSIFVPNTGWWGTFQFVGTSGVNLTAGQHLLRIYSEQEYFNLDAIQIF